MAQGTVEMRQQALAKFEEALKIWQKYWTVGYGRPHHKKILDIFLLGSVQLAVRATNY